MRRVGYIGEGAFSKRLPYADFFGYFLVRRQESNTSIRETNSNLQVSADTRNLPFWNSDARKEYSKIFLFLFAIVFWQKIWYTESIKTTAEVSHEVHP